MSESKWIVKNATLDDAERWFSLTAIVQPDFCNIDLINDDNYRSAMIKNMKRGTAIYVEDYIRTDTPIIGAMTYSQNQNHISWLAVHPDYRKRGVASSLMKHMLGELANAKEIRVKTFLYDDEYGKAARNFYKKQGFVGKDILMEEEGYPHPVQVFVKLLE
ncbi:GNAT family N-acetyltransferase [Vallitalea guaymasensis]|uniref:GNAT family N-acetyltransferase n=1 Tax=Vallitalea guaymasensis TaxID=1185412 RepID=A0A8J8M8Y1_9FIRM|nr:GNAT family N-acetyltransferase [Vallitalea guaymasensis]QUH28546.1 GNAT family N-acetyltransferase [Vallitalea guaymasensis]